jgi:hypothetical protein
MIRTRVVCLLKIYVHIQTTGVALLFIESNVRWGYQLYMRSIFLHQTMQH